MEIQARCMRLAGAMGLILALLPGATAQAELNRDGLKDNGRWVFWGRDYGDKAAKDINDPITLLFMGGKRNGSRNETSGNISDLLTDHWWPPGSMENHKCNEGKWVRYRVFSGSPPPPDDTDLNVSTSGSCKNQWHSRIWNDKEINGSATSDAKWEIGTIHRETRCHTPLLCKHHLRMSFELAEIKALRAMSTVCSIRNWRALASSGPKKYKRSYGSFYADGRISRVSMQARGSGSQPCRGAFR